MRTDTAVAIHRQDYQPPAYLVESIDIGFDLDPGHTRVAARSTLQRNPQSKQKELILHGDSLQLLALRMNGKTLGKREYSLRKGTLRILNAPDHVVLEIETLINPDKNTSLMGLYVSNGNFFTQCEAEGFRKITYFPDRPDVMAKYRVMLRADKQQYPVLLSNGNLIEEGDLGDGRHYALWEDPFKKPSYLFALVAGKLVCEEQQIRLKSGRDALLQVWVEEGNLDKTAHAMSSLIKSIRWDEERFGLELDLDRFMVVAVSDFNMGAMENKGLNIFNTKYVLANSRIATDADYAGIESVVAHEYFHNWTGNRVTCRDWFQLSLKEGLTVFRDQEFSADMMGSASGRAVKRIEDVRVLRAAQFPEDGGPMAHPVRPDSYVEINNFYTLTIYEKGAEVVRMYQTLLGREVFRRGMDLYFARHDGQAVTCDDFRAAMADAAGRDLAQFERWYSQAGTPRVKVQTEYDQVNRSYTLQLTQTCPATPGQRHKLPMHIPVAVGLIDAQGNDLPLRLKHNSAPDDHAIRPLPTTMVLELTEHTQTFSFEGIEHAPVPSLLRDFSAPVVLDYDYTDDELAFLLAHDSDPFNRWEAGQRLMTRRLLALAADGVALDQRYPPDSLDQLITDALGKLLIDETLDPAFRDLVLTLPSESMLSEQVEVIDPQAIHQARRALRRFLAHSLRSELQQVYAANEVTGPYSSEPQATGRRALRNNAVSYLAELHDASVQAIVRTQLASAGNMTDRLAALAAMINNDHPAAAGALRQFYQEFETEALVIDKWFSLQAVSHATTAGGVRELMQHPAFTIKNPNRARSLLFAFCNNNPAQFHAADGSGYSLWAEQVIVLNEINPQVAARLARALDRWRKYAPRLQAGMRAALEKVAATKALSNDVAEVIGKALAD
ncbi:MAG: aminopeptidase N [Burkholderiaceae bacterium]|jgi:aminopeptidase N